MSEQFVKLHKWMTELGLNPSEMIAFAVIHHYTVFQGGYAGGALALAKWCGIAKSNIYHVIETLIGKQLIVKLKASKGRGTSVYASIVNCPKTGQLESTEQDSYLSQNRTVNCPKTGQLESTEQDSYLSQNRTVNCPKTGHYIDNRYIDNPPTPLKGGSANADAKPRLTERKRRKPSQNFMQGERYSKDRLHEMGISTGQEIYDGFDELRIE